MINFLDLRLSIINTRLQQAEIPIVSISGNEPPYTIEFAPEATPEQRTQAAAIVAAFNPAEAITREGEIKQALPIAKQYFANHQAAIDFIRLTPEQQETQIEAMTLAQLKTVIKYLTVAVAALVKKEFL